MSIKKVLLGMLVCLSISSCSVQQFAVNTETKPFENGGKVFGEKTKVLTYKKTSDLHILGINVKESNVQALVSELEAEKYTIETKSSLWLRILSLGTVDHKTVKVIKRKG
ncbi:hypothetical protein A7A78_14250 [Aequorivita soesokkakensis]|uniref:Lipoprotein n=1 Tax=Aequorivita soesokkakensis TaxID=1385699 RepID=A0A1A9LEC3_9FLAO|nr:hypothetical protein [Aequorivita soesokkakensis]OAD90725.1 hypothetical protein A7A78_14250 [Aequorivita soesokkakensis]